jgi:RNA polymerase sigma factor (sigma-70 family)
VPNPTTQWTVVERAGQGDREARETFARVYLPVVRRYVRARWEGSHWQGHQEDAVQQVFVECLKPEGALSRVSRDDAWGFRNYLYGVARNVARSVEKQRRDASGSGLPEPAARNDSGLQQVFDRAFAESLLGEALEHQQRQAEVSGPPALRRLELLRLRFWEGLPIREISKRWEADAAHLHHEYARARDDFRAALRSVLANHCGNHSQLTEEDLVQLLASS